MKTLQTKNTVHRCYHAVREQWIAPHIPLPSPSGGSAPQIKALSDSSKGSPKHKCCQTFCHVTKLVRLESLLKSLSWKLKLHAIFCKGGSAFPQLKPKQRQFVTEYLIQEFEFEDNNAIWLKTLSKSLGLLQGEV